jgi:hypothetical protein
MSKNAAEYFKSPGVQNDCGGLRRDDGQAGTREKIVGFVLVGEVADAVAHTVILWPG